LPSFPSLQFTVVDRLISLVCLPILVTGAFPLWQAWRANRHTTLLQAVNWAIGAWAAWLWVLLSDVWPPADPGLTGFLALSLTGCAGVAVLGARRPGVGPWNFVVLGLLLVLLMPLLQSRFAGRELEWDVPRTLFLVGTLTVALVNYLATRLAPAALLLAVAVAGEMLLLTPAGVAVRSPELVRAVSRVALAAAPWLGYALLRTRPRAASEFDRLWLGFRDRFGLVWGQRVREQFNHAAVNAGWPVRLRWQGLRIAAGSRRPNEDAQKEIVAALRALLKRFGAEE
jgi:hypothetical protein